jgi:Tol biopolymer transport system component
MVFVSDRDDPNFAECSQDNSCWTQVFYTPNILGGQAVNLTGPRGFIGASDPALSNNGRQVAFSGSLPGGQGSHIYIINIDGTGLVQVSPEGYTHLHPSWSPDDSALVFMSSPLDSAYYNLYIAEIDGLQTRAITGGEAMDRFPDWSPDGSQVAFHSNRADPDPAGCWPSCETGLYKINLETLLGNQLFYDGEPLTGAALDWSPDGNQFAYHSLVNGDWEIFIRDQDRNVFQLTDNSGIDTYPNWSPDGQFIAYASETPDGMTVAIIALDLPDPLYLELPGSWNTQPDW